MVKTVTPPRGMRDFLPADKALREHALGVIRSVFNAHGFDEIETPVMESADHLHAGLGGDNEKLAFAVMRRGLGQADLQLAAASGDQLLLADLGLRYDLTVPLSRFYATNQALLPPVFRALQVAPVWRAERPQKGRFRQFMQCDIDIIGEQTLLAELELLSAGLAALDALGLTGCTIRINDRRVLTKILETWGVAAEHTDSALIIMDKLDKIGNSGVVAELVASGAVASEKADQISHDLAEFQDAGWGLAELAGDSDWLDRAAYQDLLALRAALPAGVLVFDPTLVRGMGYYTGTIFEIAHPDFSYSLGGGGRYDGMIGRFLGKSVPACGFSIGFERIIDLLKRSADNQQHAVVLIYETDTKLELLLALKSKLVTEGKRVRLERRVKNMRALFDRVTAEGFTEYAQVRSDTGYLEFRSLVD